MEMRIELKGLTCANCAGKIETAVNGLKETEGAEINLMKQTMTLSLQDGADDEAMFRKVAKIVAQYEPEVEVSLNQGGFAAKTQEEACCSEGHYHGHHEKEEHEADESPMKMLLRFGGGLLLFLTAVFLKENMVSTVLFLVAYLIFGYDVLLRAVKNIARGQVFDENFLMTVSTIGAIAIGEMPEAVFVMLFYQVGEAFQEYAVARSRKSITALLDIRPDHAELVRDGNVVEVAPEVVQVGDLIQVKAGERIPLDGTIEMGEALLDTAALTGEALPQSVGIGSEVLSGCINLNGTLRIRVSKPFGESTVMKILEMVENAAGRKSRTERFITRFARIYTPVVVGLAVLLATIPPVLGMGEFSMWFGRALIFLMVSCPCALVLSVPLSYFAGIGAASKSGILVKGGGDLDTLCHVQRIVFDKTGTLTKGEFSVIEIQGDHAEELLFLAAAGEAMSNHPIAAAVVKKYKETKTTDLPSVEEYVELGGFGISYVLEGEKVLLGNSRLMETEGIPFAQYHGGGTVIYGAKNGVYLGCLIVADTIKDGCKEALAALREKGVKEMVMLTGDRKENAEAVAKELGLDQVYAELLPQDKVRLMEELKSKDGHLKTAFVGDGINDAPVLAGADLGIAMGGIGSDAAIEAADVVLMDDDIGKVAVGIRIAKNTRRIVQQNVAFALGIKVLALILSAIGMVSMWIAVFADVGVSVLAVLNAMRKK